MTGLITLPAHQRQAREVIIDGIGKGDSARDIVVQIQDDCGLNESEAFGLFTALLDEITLNVSTEQQRRDLNFTIAVTRYTTIYKIALEKKDLRAALAALDRICELQKIDTMPRKSGNRGDSPSVAGGAVFNGPVQINNNDVTHMSNEELEQIATGTKVINSTAVPKVMTNAAVRDLMESEIDDEH